MWKYAVKRILLAAVSVFIIIAITFFLMKAVPGGPFAREKAISPAAKAVLVERYNLDKPEWQQFLLYIDNMMHGDFGISLKTGREISTIIGESFKISAKLGGISMVSALFLGLLFGCIAAIYRNKWPDRVIIFFTTLFCAVPSFILATLLLLIFSMRLGWVSAWSATDTSYILPVVALMLYPMSYITRLTKSSLLDVLGQDYIRTAKAKGLRDTKVISKHALRNALIPVITYVGPMTAYILTGSLVVETVFTIGGLGSKFIDGITNRDYPMIMATTIFLAVLIVIMSLISDLCYKLADPNIDFD